MGVIDRYFIFLNEVGLEYGEAEENSIKARNAFAHSDRGMADHDSLQKTKTIFLLAGRVIRKLPEYDGDYIDETIPGFPGKGIGSKIG